MNKLHVVIVAAGVGSRFGGDTPKQYLPLAGQSVLARSIAAFEGAANIIVVISKDHQSRYEKIFSALPLDIKIVHGGPSRQQSVYKGIQALSDLQDTDLILIHDAARPLISKQDILNIANKASETGAATLASCVADTLYSLSSGPVDRNNLWAIQTPQAFHYGLIKKAHESAASHESYTDDADLVRAIGHPVELVAAKDANFKITLPGDLAMAEKILSANLSTEIRTGQGYDVHAFDETTHNATSIRLCGVDIPYNRKLSGHSDADVALHALTDAILGAIGEGDIGLHFPPSDMSYKDMDSALFLKRALKLMSAKGGRLLNVDVTLICEEPKIGPHRAALRARIAEILEISPERVNIKATTTEKLGFTGRKEGIAAQAIATVSIPAPEV